MTHLLADETLDPIQGLGPFGQTHFGTGGALAMQKLTGAISAIIGLMTLVAAIWFFIQFTIGGISWITAAGDKAKLTQARDRITNAFVGLVIVVAGWAVLALAGQFFGWNNILLPTGVENVIIFQ